MPLLDIQTLQRLRRVLNLSAIAEEAGMNKNTLLAKVAKGRELTAEESAKISKVLADHGLNVELPTYHLPDGSIDHIALSKLPRDVRQQIIRKLLKGAENCYGPDDIIQVDVEIFDEY